MDGIWNIRKEKGFTSHDVVAVVRKILHTKKVGHTGTLDPDAEGVLPICVGKATKLSEIIMDGTKVYRAMVRLGITTKTEDASGEVVEQNEVHWDADAIREATQQFVGEIAQVPPMYSAIKVHGKKLYELAREGKEIARKARTVTIYGIQICRFLPPDRFEMEIACSKGTYIRTLCSDIGVKLGCGAHMESLIRTRTGTFRLEDAITLEELKTLAEEGKAEEAMLSMEAALTGYPRITVSAASTKLLYHGAKIYQGYYHCEQPLSAGTVAAVFDSRKNLVGLYTVQKEETVYIKPYKMLI